MYSYNFQGTNLHFLAELFVSLHTKNLIYANYLSDSDFYPDSGVYRNIRFCHWFGAYVAGVAVAIGGGTIRDVLLDVTPFWMTNPIYLICSALALLWVIFFRKHLIHMHNTFFIFDSIGLALFTVVGISKTIDLGYAFWVAIIMGTMTGAAGGVIRDVFINEIPLIFRKEIYAMACVIGGVIYWGLDRLGVDAALTQVISGCCIFVVRALAVKYQICLPILKGE